MNKLIILEGAKDMGKTTALVKLADYIHKNGGILLDAFWVPIGRDPNRLPKYVLQRLSGITPGGVSANPNLNSTFNISLCIQKKYLQNSNLCMDYVFIFWYKGEVAIICTGGDNPQLISVGVNLNISISININPNIRLCNSNIVCARTKHKASSSVFMQTESVFGSVEREYSLSRNTVFLNGSLDIDRRQSKAVSDIVGLL